MMKNFCLLLSVLLLSACTSSVKLNEDRSAVPDQAATANMPLGAPDMTAAEAHELLMLKPETPTLPPRHLRDETAVPFVPAEGREDYKSWLQWHQPKAFAISENGKWYAAHGNLSTAPTIPANPSQRALQFCEQRAQMPCKLYAVNADVVWGTQGVTTTTPATK